MSCQQSRVHRETTVWRVIWPENSTAASGGGGGWLLFSPDTHVTTQVPTNHRNRPVCIHTCRNTRMATQPRATSNSSNTVFWFQNHESWKKLYYTRGRLFLPKLCVIKMVLKKRLEDYQESGRKLSAAWTAACRRVNAAHLFAFLILTISRKESGSGSLSLSH